MSMLTVAAKIALNFALIAPFGFLGLALATTVASWINLGLLLGKLRHRTGTILGIAELGVFVRIGLAAFAMGMLSLLAFHFSWMICPGSEWAAQAFRLGLAIVTGMATLFPLLNLLKVAEGKEVLRLAVSVIGKIR
jgi:putative peptidoglycan lipid II flippase